MPAIPTVGGVACFWGGVRQLPVRGNFKVQPNNFQWQGVAGQDGLHGRKRVPVIPTVEANISDDGTLSLQDLVAMVDAMATVELDNGKSYIYQQVWYSGLAQLDTDEGHVRVKFEAPTAHEEQHCVRSALRRRRGKLVLEGLRTRAGCGGPLLHAFASTFDCWRLRCCLRRRSRSMDARSTRLIRV